VRARVLAGAGRRRHELRQRRHEVGGDAPHDEVALDGALPGHGDVALGQVAQAAVHELARPPRGAVGQVVALHERHPQAARRRVEGDPGAGHAAADHEHVVGGSGGEGLEVAAAARGVEQGEGSAAGRRSSAHAASSR
jgi:hypothetical protein